MKQQNSDQGVAVRVEGVSKFFPKRDGARSIKQFVTSIGKRRGKDTAPQGFWALRDISLDIQKGDFIGIVGRNGSGKSTLLKIIAGVYSPTSGAVTVSGKLVPFIELGVGFNPELSGRDNVFLNGALLGFDRKDTEKMYDDIVDFAELKDHMHVKLKNFSSGMQVRLAFSIAIRAKADVLVIDEVLAVGDEAFQRKCFDYFEQIKARKQTVILVTHDMKTVEQFCSKAMLLRDSKVAMIGKPSDVATEYIRENQEQIKRQGHVRHAPLQKTDVSITLLNGKKKSHSFNVGDTMTTTVSWKYAGVANVGISIHKQSGERMFSTNTFATKLQPNIKAKKKCSYEVGLHLAPGTYYVRLRLLGDSPHETIELINDGPMFDIFAPTTSDRVEGLVRLPHKWS